MATLGDPSMWTKNPMSWSSPDRPAFSETSIANALIGEPHNPWVKNLQPANNTRVNGWMKMSEMIHDHKFYVIKGRCPNLVRTIPLMIRDEKNPEDVDTKAEDHLYDALRYGIMTRPRSNLFDYSPLTSNSGFQVADETFGY